jgi:hypothetical protein
MALIFASWYSRAPGEAWVHSIVNECEPAGSTGVIPFRGVIGTSAVNIETVLAGTGPTELVPRRQKPRRRHLPKRRLLDVGAGQRVGRDLRRVDRISGQVGEAHAAIVG